MRKGGELIILPVCFDCSIIPEEYKKNVLSAWGHSLRIPSFTTYRRTCRIIVTVGLAYDARLHLCLMRYITGNVARGGADCFVGQRCGYIRRVNWARASEFFSKFEKKNMYLVFFSCSFLIAKYFRTRRWTKLTVCVFQSTKYSL